MYKARSEITEKLLSLPESGMGYQFIRATKNSEYSVNEYIAFNAEYVQPIDRNSTNGLLALEESNFSIMAMESLMEMEIDLNPASISLIDIHSIEKNLIHEAWESFSKSEKCAIENNREYADGNEFVVRLSAYKNDKRIDFVNRCLLPGSFTTTLDDFYYLREYTLDPVERYALPNNYKINWAFFVQPSNADILQRGVV